MRRGTVLATLAALALLALPAAASAAPELQVGSSHIPAAVPAGTHGIYTLAVSNPGDASTTEPIEVDFSVPAGYEVTKASAPLLFGFIQVWQCTGQGHGSQSVSCVDGLLPPLYQLAPGQEACQPFGTTCPITVVFRVADGATPGPFHPTISACGGGVSTCPTPATTTDDPIEVGPPTHFEVTSFDATNLREDGEPATQAGSHPNTSSAEFTFPREITGGGFEVPVETLEDGAVELPPGLLGNPRAMPRCTPEQIASASGTACPADSQIGTVTIEFDGQPGHPFPEALAVYNLVPSHGTPAEFAFNLFQNVTHISAKIRTGEDYGVTLMALNVPEVKSFSGVRFDFWGVPGAPSHDAERCWTGDPAFPVGCPTGAPLRPLVSLPTSCLGPVQTSLHATTWLGSEASASVLSHDNTLPTPNPVGFDGCNALDYSSPATEPSLEARPTTNVADSASGLDVDLHLPQNESCDPGPPVSCENAEAHLRDATVTLPEGLVINPAGANGLDGCSEAGFGYTSTDPDGTIHTTPDPATCPDASRQGNLEVETPVLDHPLKGSVYLAKPYANPFGSLLAIYLTVDDPQTGIVVKLAGKVTADPNTGQLSATFTQNPQLPFEDFKLHFFGGAGGALRTPATCGTYQTTSSLTPWSAPESGPPATPSDAWAIQTAPGGGTCPTSQGQRPNSPDLDAGSLSPVAGISTPTIVNLRRNDGSQEFSSVKLTLPPGLTGKLAGIGQCSDRALAGAIAKTGQQEKSAPSCPTSSRIGTVDVAAGAGPAPYNTQGTAYLAGPYKGAPLSMAIVTPATAGPFDLGTVVVRVALFIDRDSAQITAVSDRIPSILQGIPLDIRAAKVTLDRQSFTRNGTSCDPSSFEGSLVSTLNSTASLSERFQLGECSSLAFKPKLGIRLIGGTKRGAHPALQASLRMPEGGANIGKAVVALPHSEFLDQSHIGTICTRVQYAANQCPAASVYGSVKVTSPLVDYPLEGPAILRSSDNKLPDLVMALHGPPSQPIEVDAVGRIDSVNRGIRTSFEGTPDIPVSTLVLNMAGGKKGLLQNSTNICKGTHKATAEFDGQNGKAADFEPALKNSKCGKQKKKRAAQHRAAR
jgi:hypothetical protein